MFLFKLNKVIRMALSITNPSLFNVAFIHGF
jgi:hypothetical protein